MVKGRVTRGRRRVGWGRGFGGVEGGGGGGGFGVRCRTA
jgi:hypothetical protein